MAVAHSSRLKRSTIAFMGSLSLGEILVILVVVLVVFGPRRLPDLSRRIGAWLAKAREATSYVAKAIDSSYEEVIEPIRELKGEYDGLKGDVTRAVSSFGKAGDTTTPTGGTADPQPAADNSDGATDPADQ